MTPIFALILEAGLRWGPVIGMKIADIWQRSGSLTPEQAVAELSAILVEINSKTVDGAIAEAEARAGGPIPVTGTVTLGPAP